MQHRCAAHRASGEVGQRTVGVLERVVERVGANRDLVGESQQRPPILARVGGDAAQLALLKQVARIVELGDRGQMDPRNGGGVEVLEAGDGVDVTAFSNITGQVVESKIMEAYTQPTGPNLEGRMRFLYNRMPLIYISTGIELEYREMVEAGLWMLEARMSLLK